MQHIRAGGARSEAPDQRRERAAVGGSKVQLGIHAGCGRFQQHPVRAIQVKVAVETDGAQPQHDVVSRVGRERPQVQITQGNRSGIVAAVGHGPAFVTRRHNELLRKLGQMQHIRAGGARSEAPDQRRKRAAVGSSKVQLGIHAGCDRFQQHPVRAIQVEVAVEPNRTQPQHDVVSCVGRERPQVQITQRNRSGIIAAVGHGPAFITRRHNKRLRKLGQMQDVCAGGARSIAPDQRRERAAIGGSEVQLGIHAGRGRFQQDPVRTI